MSLKSASLFAVGILAALSVSTITGVNSATVPHPDCTVSETLTRLLCNTGNYSIPGNFDLSVVPQSITTIILGSLLNTNAIVFRPDRLSTIHDNAPALSMTRLTQLTLYSVQGTNGKRVPIEAFLTNVKGTLTNLELRGCRIGSVGSTFLQGFRSLKVLRLVISDLSAIDINAFETRVSLSDAALPVITTIALEQNEISTLDWAVFAPVAHSVQTLSLNNQEGTTGLRTLTISKSFTFAVLGKLDLQENDMGFPPRAILDSLNIKTGSFINFDNNAFCPDEQENTCSCCEAKDFITWAHEIGTRPFAQKPTQLGFSCGDNAATSHFDIFGNLANIPSKDQYGGCAAGGTAKPTVGTATTKTTSRTTMVTSVTPPTRPNQLGGSSSGPSGPSSSGWINRSVTGLYGITLVVILSLQCSL